VKKGWKPSFKRELVNRSEKKIKRCWTLKKVLKRPPGRKHKLPFSNVARLRKTSGQGGGRIREGWMGNRAE